ncbi:MAG: enoyl-CoA hydratase-related protein [Proteobacteria bacterium]|nr:enoyl-CoA hydratase-related protein [Pseudomonadota bacterium]
MSTDPVLVEREGAIATVVLNNPAKRNALGLAAWQRLIEIMAELDVDDTLRCVIVTGSGDKAFAAGADISEFPRLRATADQGYEYGKATELALTALRTLKHPTIAMIQGACTGGGLEIAACCDLRIAAADARFGVPISKLGHAFAAPEMKPLLDLVGKALTLELLLEGRILDAEEALRRGLVNRVVAVGDLAREVAETSQRIAAGAPLSLRVTKATLNRLMDDPTPVSEAEVRAGYTPCDSLDYREGYTAFLEKRPPVFKGK